MFDELVDLARLNIDDETLAEVVVDILHDHRAVLLELPAATRNHHAYVGGFLEHVLSVTRTCVYLADKYAQHLPDMSPPLDKGLVVAGGMLHDIGKVRELERTASGAQYTPSGVLLGHIIQGRDIIREVAASKNLDEEKLLRLEHIVVSHQRLAEWGSPKHPMTPEALLVHFADDIDAKMQMVAEALAEGSNTGPFTSSRNGMNIRLSRGRGSDGEVGS